MHQRDIERFSFLYLCGQRDRDLLAGRERMTFQDFERMVYITELLGLSHLSLEIWNQFSSQFKEQLEALEKLHEKNYRDMELEYREYEDDNRNYDEWITQFCVSAPDDETRGFLINIFESYHEEDRKKKGSN